MKQRTYTIVAVVIIILVIIGLCWYYTLPNNGPVAATVPTTVTFGNPGTCMGCGMCTCMAPAVARSGSVDTTKMVHVSFNTLPNTPNVVVMSFSLAELTSNAPQQVPYFQNGGSYIFPTMFSFDDPIFSSLGLPAGTCLLPTSKSVISINGDVVTNTITLDTVPPPHVNSSVIFGNPLTPPGPRTAAPQQQAGISSVAALPTGIGVASVSAPYIPVTFMLQQGNPKVLLMIFSLSALTANQPGQVSLFPNNGSYAFTDTILLSNPAFAALQGQLQGAAPQISPASASVITINGDVVTDAITYDPQP